MIKDSKGNLFEYVLVHKLDRFARNRYDQAIYERELNNNNVKLISVLEQFNDSPESVILKSVITGINEYYSLNLSRETKKGLYENFHNNKHAGGIPPLGLDVDKETKLYIINEEEADIVRLIFKLAIEGNGYTKIAQLLNERNLINKRKKPFTKSGIRDLLRNEKYIGTYILGKKDKNGKITNREERKEDVIPAILDRETFYTVQELLLKKSSTGRSDSKVDYLLTGFLKCGECSGSFSGGGKTNGRNKQYRMYNCTNRKSKKTDCMNPKIRKEVIEDLVFKTIRNLIFSSDRLDLFISELTNKIKFQNKNSADLKKKNDKDIQNIKSKKEKLLTLFLDGFITEEEFKSKNDTLELELIEKIRIQENLNNTKNININDISSYVKRLADALDSQNIPIKKQILQTFVEEVIIYKETINIKLKFFGLVDGGYDGGSG
ncbi:recombinase family protein, partial [Sebaldella sp. S0638]|nr:recombinase family protein [Sebaldella sp. S0638]